MIIFMVSSLVMIVSALFWSMLFISLFEMYYYYYHTLWHYLSSTNTPLQHLLPTPSLYFVSGYLNGVIDYWDKTFEDILDLHENENIVTTPSEISSSLHAAHLFQQKVEAVIKTHAVSYPSIPMFLMYPTQLIHSPWDAPESYIDRCALFSGVAGTFPPYSHFLPTHPLSPSLVSPPLRSLPCVPPRFILRHPLINPSPPIFITLTQFTFPLIRRCISIG